MMQHQFKVLVTSVFACTMVIGMVPSSVAAEIQATTNNVEVDVHQGTAVNSTRGEEDANLELAPLAKSAVVMDYATGKILFEKDENERLALASVTKVMTMLLIMEALESGKLSLSDQIKTSEYAASMGGSQVFLEPGESMTAKDMLKGIAMASANDACVAMAEHLSGSEATFVKVMNHRAEELGMTNTHFVNCNGLPAENHYSSAHDIAIMSRELLKHEQITKYTSVYSDYLRKDSEHPFWLVNTNKLVRFYDGMDGLKTGYTSDAKFCLSASAQRKGFRVITVVMGEPRAADRSKEATQLFNWAFSNYASKVIYTPGQFVTERKIYRGVPEKLTIVAGDTIGVIIERGKDSDHETEIKLNDDLKAPIKKGERVGTILIKDENHAIVTKGPLVAQMNINRAGFFRSIARTIGRIVTFGQS
jgi:D-alanyl-D-alanine carboxypeptidase (penicillin-binding protein 5/6)